MERTGLYCRLGFRVQLCTWRNKEKASETNRNKATIQARPSKEEADFPETLQVIDGGR
ncbi:hypothetical protein CCACVL1_22427 [Corchorus capsularis]|uniref:Uncharacterized protein n=1 Tax=Corchorus capsularis TaxID=210143 RepID=A0A1R3GYV2_COCAP|nr:hypothetical protein CCACVL1_22427 [Corchorus capsularis]